MCGGEDVGKMRQTLQGIAFLGTESGQRYVWVNVDTLMVAVLSPMNRPVWTLASLMRAGYDLKKPTHRVLVLLCYT